LSKIKYVAKALALKKRLQDRYQVDGLDMKSLMFGSSGLNIVYTSQYFQPCADTFDDRYLFVGPSIAERPETTPFPWELVRRDAMIYVSMGTLFNRDASFYRACFEAFRDEDFQVIMSTGAAVASESLGPAPANFIVKAYTPQLKILQQAGAFVTHGGMNSVCESFSFGVPVLVIPQMGEQEIVGRRLEELGAGLYLEKQAATAGQLRAMVRRLLTEKTFRTQTALVRESFQNAAGVAGAVDAILSFTR
jgi:MGT family glycosyltransferase